MYRLGCRAPQEVIRCKRIQRRGVLCTIFAKSLLQYSFCYYYGMHASGVSAWTAAAINIHCKASGMHAKSQDACYLTSGILLSVAGSGHSWGHVIAPALNHAAPLFPPSHADDRESRQRDDVNKPAKHNCSTRAGGVDSGSASTAYVPIMADVRDDAISIKASELHVEFDDCDEIPAHVRQSTPQRMLAIETNGDGACGIHAVFGHPNANRELFLPAARAFAAQASDRLQTAASAGASRIFVQSVQISLWDEFARPYLEKNPCPEATMFWKSLSDMSPELAAESQEIQDLLIEKRWAVDTAKTNVKHASRIFFGRDMEHFVRRLAVLFEYLPGGIDVFSMTPEALEDVQSSGCSSFLESAKTADGFVKGTRTPFPQGGPSCKYTALFDQRPCFDALRTSFIVNVDPQSGPRALLCALANVLEDDATEYTNIAKALEFIEKLREWGNEAVPAEKPLEFATRAWPAYLQCIAENPNYFFSVEEILLMSARVKVNVVIFKQIGSTLTYAGGTFGAVKGLLPIPPPFVFCVHGFSWNIFMRDQRRESGCPHILIASRHHD